MVHSKPKLLYFSNDLAFFLSHRNAFAAGAVAAGFDVHVAVRNGSTAPPTDGITWHNWPLVRGVARPDLEITAYRSTQKLLENLKPDIAECITFKPIMVAGFLLARHHNIPVVNAVMGLGSVFGTPNTQPVLRALCRPMLKRSFTNPRSRVIIENADDAQTLVEQYGIKPNNIIVIPGAGVDVEEFKPKPQKRKGLPIVLFAARMIEEKGVRTFVEAAGKLKEAGAKARFVLCGTPDKSKPTAIPEVELRAWHKSGVVEWWGYCEDMAEVMAQASILCMPSEYGEGAPKAIVEAAAAGLAIVATDIPGCRALVKEGKTGFLIPPGDGDRLTDSLGRLIENRQLRDELSENAREFAVSTLAVDKVVSTTIDLYRSLLNEY